MYADCSKLTFGFTSSTWRIVPAEDWTQLEWCSRKLTSSSACQEPHPVPVHCLGRGTSGILLCAKTKLAKSYLAAYFADGTSVGVSRHANSELKTMRKITKTY
ncbi:unnamed protein product [Fraxinus pennsylvanica]|uniref:Uncharacterized protein n=1 Tax=Fraxinus pennsylvanica TaxID=56036 RepID=A0AAD2DWL3_9LAMI|nr:unnamed protein product [Fraxinus pennsylvanica]